MRPYEGGDIPGTFPWHIEEDWEYEIVDANNKLIGKFTYGKLARDVVKTMNAKNGESS